MPAWLERMRRDTGAYPPGRPHDPGTPDAVVPPRDRPGPRQSPTSPQPEDPPGRGRPHESGKADAATVLTAVRGLPGVRGAELVGEPGRPQVLRLDLVASVDPHTVGRQAAALLRDQLGVNAAVRARSQRDSHALPRGPQRPDPPERVTRPESPPALAVSIEQVQVVTAGPEAAVEVGLAASGVRVAGRASGPAHDWHVLRAAVTAATEALGMLLAGRARLSVEYAELVSAGPAKLAVVSLLLLSGDGTERVAGAAPVTGEAPAAAVRATIAAVRHRLPDLLDDAAIGR
ncbi:MAG TPA: hypothetical protein VFZ32_00195 [Micromonosporaceae bacterium]